MERLRDYLLLAAQIVAIFSIIAIGSDIKEIKQMDAAAPVAAYAPIDYEKINEIVTERMEAIPRPKDGENGSDGVDGKDATLDESFIRSVIQEEVAKIPKPKDGANTETVRETVIQKPEFRTNPANGNFEWRIIGDDSWQIIKRACEFLGVCNGQAE